MNSHDPEHWRQPGHPFIAGMPYPEAYRLFCYDNDFLKDGRASNDYPAHLTSGIAGGHLSSRSGALL